MKLTTAALRSAGYGHLLDEKPKQPAVKRRGVMNKLEADFSNELGMNPDLSWHGFEKIKLWLGDGVWWTPDFAAKYRVVAGGNLFFYEVKGSWKAKNQRDARTRIKIAASMYPQFTFIGVTRVEGEWRYEEFGK